MKPQINGFTRQETISLTDCTSSRLAYLEKIELIIPERIGLNSKPIVIFSWEQLISICAIRYLKLENVPLNGIKIFVNFLTQTGYSDELKNKRLIILEDEIFWIEPDWRDFAAQLPKQFKTPNKNLRAYLLLVIPPLDYFVQEIWERAANCPDIDFQSFEHRVNTRGELFNPL